MPEVPTRRERPIRRAAATPLAQRLLVSGTVQGVGFRPFVWRLATELGLDGAVRNRAGRVEIELLGPPGVMRRFARRLRREAPARSAIERVVFQLLEEPGAPALGQGFAIDESSDEPAGERHFPPDLATCDECVRELFDPADRRYRYPFINCTTCGPRATIIEALPYDRAQTSMDVFKLCPACAAEYRDPADRRFHAEPVACWACGPRLWYRIATEATPALRDEAALVAAVDDLRRGWIVAVKGLGGYHLACDARDTDAVERLRERKLRWAKPFAVMAADLATACGLAVIGDAERRLLLSPARPIVLARAHSEAPAVLVPGVLNGRKRVGVMLPYSGLHHLLLRELGFPIVLTSANRADEPIVTDDAEAPERLEGVADSYLGHDRVIRARYDDSVTRVADGRPSVIRRGRGYAPASMALPVPATRPLLAVGAELKHTFTLALGGHATMSPHIGDLEDLLTFQAFEGTLAHLTRLLDLQPEIVAHDLHPAYLSTQLAMARFPTERRVAVQHHHAHLASCAAEHGLLEPFIGVAYDGLGMGDDGTFWGGEVLLADLRAYRRFGRFALAPLPGGAAAIKRPYRMALGYLFGVEGGDLAWLDPTLAAPFLERLERREVEIVRRQVARGLNTPLASSAGRLFDAASSLLGLRDVAEFEGDAAIALEQAASSGERAELPWLLEQRADLLVYDPRPTLAALLAGLRDGVNARRLAARFQRTIASVTLALCREARLASGLSVVCLSGGVFQNQWLVSSVSRLLRAEGFRVLLNREVPVNDGGISYGQAAIAAARLVDWPT